MNFPLRLPPLVDAKVRAEAKRLGLSLNGYISMALVNYIDGAVTPTWSDPVGSQLRAQSLDEAAFKARQMGLQGLEDPKPTPPPAAKKKPPRRPLDGPALIAKLNEGLSLSPDEKVALRAYREAQKAAKRR